MLETVPFALAAADDTRGVIATEIKIGNTNADSVIAKLDTAFFNMINDQGGVAGRKINFITLDDDFSPPETILLSRLLRGVHRR